MGYKVDWYYHRNSWNSCTRTQEFLSELSDVSISTQLDARKERIASEQALELLGQADSLVVIKWEKINRFDLSDYPPSNEELLKQVMGPSGNLRALSMRMGKAFVVGYHSDAYQELFD